MDSRLSHFLQDILPHRDCQGGSHSNRNLDVGPGSFGKSSWWETLLCSFGQGEGTLQSEMHRSCRVNGIHLLRSHANPETLPYRETWCDTEGLEKVCLLVRILSQNQSSSQNQLNCQGSEVPNRNLERALVFNFCQTAASAWALISVQSYA